MRTSYQQFAIMVDFMEQNGDLSKPSGGPRGRHLNAMKWKELATKLNTEGTGDFRTEDKWRKVWSDFKNNTKKKYAKINKECQGTGGGPALQLALNELEYRVIQIIGVQAATGIGLEEAGFPQNESEITAHTSLEDWNTPGTSSQPTVTPMSTGDQLIPTPIGDPVALTPHKKVPSQKLRTPPQTPTGNIQEEYWTPPLKTKKLHNKISTAQLFLECERNTREHAKEREKISEKLETERLRLHSEELRLRELEINERVRQRDIELQLQLQWQELFKEALKILESYNEKRNN